MFSAHSAQGQFESSFDAKEPGYCWSHRRVCSTWVQLFTTKPHRQGRAENHILQTAKHKLFELRLLGHIFKVDCAFKVKYYVSLFNSKPKYIIEPSLMKDNKDVCITHRVLQHQWPYKSFVPSPDTKHDRDTWGHFLCAPCYKSRLKNNDDVSLLWLRSCFVDVQKPLVRVRERSWFGLTSTHLSKFQCLCDPAPFSLYIDVTWFPSTVWS